MLIIYQIVQMAVLILFAVHISDLRKKDGMIPLINPRLVLTLKLSYPIPTLTYAYILITAKEFLLVTDLVALCFTLLGVWLTMRAKKDLGTSHTWTGYGSTTAKLVTQGIYAWIRHPLYTGIYLFIIGANLVSLTHGSWLMAGIVIVGTTYISVMLATSARRETVFLAQRFGAEYTSYQRRVHSFLPIRRFEE